MIGIDFESGDEILIEDSTAPLIELFKKNLDGSKYSAVLRPEWSLQKGHDGYQFIPLLTSKYKNTVAGAIIHVESKGLVLLVPQFRDKLSVIEHLIHITLPELSSKLYPFHEGTKWLIRPEYEHPTVQRLLEKKAIVEQQAAAALAVIDKEVLAERERLNYLHGILTKSGEPLVDDVKRTLEFLGFTNVIDVDEVAQEGGPKQEDLQIHDTSPILLVEVKGIHGLPTEGDTVQVIKYVPRRMKEWRRTDVAGAVIVNHQRACRRYNAPMTEFTPNNKSRTQSIMIPYY